MKADTNPDGKASRARRDAFAKSLRRDLELNEVKGAELSGQRRWWNDLDANKDGW
jgi:hypothetical protein